MAKKTVFLLCSILFFQFISAQSQFVKVKGDHFYINNTPYFYIGTNYWYGGLLPLKKDEKKGIDRLREELDFLKKNGVINLRVLAGSEGKGIINGVTRVGPPIQPEEGVFDPNFLKGMDVFLNELDKRKMTAVI
ncbi:MAG: hypothetical protein ACRDE8_14420, partial [Ginsengibacter sp.]